MKNFRETNEQIVKLKLIKVCSELILKGISIETLVNANTAESGVTNVLFHWGLWPATNLWVVAECSFAIVVSVPQRNWSSWSASTLTSHNGAPHGGWGVDTWNLSLSFNLFDHWVQVVTVWTAWISTPWTAWWGVGFNVNPDHTVGVSVGDGVNAVSSSPALEIVFETWGVGGFLEWHNLVVNFNFSVTSWHSLGTWEVHEFIGFLGKSDTVVWHVGDQSVGLVSGRLSSAWEHIDINVLDTSSSGILNLRGSVGISSTIWAPGSGDGETHTVGFQAWIGGWTGQLWEISTSGGKSCWG